MKIKSDVSKNREFFDEKRLRMIMDQFKDPKVIINIIHRCEESYNQHDNIYSEEYDMSHIMDLFAHKCYSRNGYNSADQLVRTLIYEFSNITRFDAIDIAEELIRHVFGNEANGMVDWRTIIKSTTPTIDIHQEVPKVAKTLGGGTLGYDPTVFIRQQPKQPDPPICPPQKTIDSDALKTALENHYRFKTDHEFKPEQVASLIDLYSMYDLKVLCSKAKVACDVNNLILDEIDLPAGINSIFDMAFKIDIDEHHYVRILFGTVKQINPNNGSLYNPYNFEVVHSH